MGLKSVPGVVGVATAAAVAGAVVFGAATGSQAAGKGKPPAGGSGAVVVSDATGTPVAGAFLDDGPRLLRDGVVWRLDWDGTVFSLGYVQTFADESCTVPLARARGAIGSLPVQASVEVDGMNGVFALTSETVTGSNFFGFGYVVGSDGTSTKVCQPQTFDFPDTYRVVDTRNPLTTPTQIAGPLTLAVG